MSETLAEATARVFGFNPNQKRGFGGKWIKVGDMVRSTEHREGGSGRVVSKHADGKVSVEFEDPHADTGTSVKKVSADSLTKSPKLPKLTPAQKKAREERLNDIDRM